MALTAKRKLFIDAYLKCFNATQAAREAGYSGDDNALSSTGWDLLRNTEIKEILEKHFAASAMSANEVLMRMADMARGDLGDFADVKSIEDLRHHPKSHLVKKVKQKSYFDKSIGEMVTEVELELYSAQTSQQDLAKRWALFTDKMEVSGQIENTLVILPPKDD